MDPLNLVDEDQPNKGRCLSSTINDTNDSANDNNNHHIPVRTVFVGGYGADMADRAKCHFERFGEIESVSTRSESNWKRRCLVQFKREEDAAKALQCTEKPWYDFKTEPADSLDQPDHPLNTPPDSESNIVCVLNDDCVQEIFQCLKLLPDLTNVAGVCVRFNQQAKITFDAKHKNLDIHREHLSGQASLETAMEHFGEHIRSLTTCSGDFKTEASAIDVIARCCGPKLKRLELDGFQFQSDLEALRPILTGVEQLKLLDCYDSIRFSELMAGCVALKSLTISSSYGCYRRINNLCAMEQTFPKLQELSLNLVKVEDEMFESFVIRHSTLIKLSIEGAPIKPSEFHTIGQHAKNLQELKFIGGHHPGYYNHEIIQNDVAFIGQLTSLKKLHIDSHSVSILSVLNALVSCATPIESLEIWFRNEPIGDVAMECIWQLKQIKSFRLTTNHTIHYLSDVDIINLVKNLPELEELDVEDCGHASLLSIIGLRKAMVHATKLKLLKLRIDSIKIDIDDYKAMLSAVQKRKEKVPLVIKIHGKAGQIDVPATVLAGNRESFDVKLIR